MSTQLNERLIRLMNERGLKQKDLVRITGIKKGSISRYVRGTATPKQDRIPLLARALGVTDAYLSSGVHALTEQEEAWLRLFRALSDTEREQIAKHYRHALHLRKVGD